MLSLKMQNNINDNNNNKYYIQVNEIKAGVYYDYCYY